MNMNCVSHTVVENLKQFAFKGDTSRAVHRTFWLIKVVPTWKNFEKRWSRQFGEMKSLLPTWGIEVWLLGGHSVSVLVAVLSAVPSWYTVSMNML
jgi:hypothetical protein